MSEEKRQTLAYCLVFFAIFFCCASFANAQTLSLDLSNNGTLSGRVIQLFLAVTILSLAPGLAMMVTCFPFIVTVLSILRQAIGLQQAPPNMMITSLAMFLTFFIMAPTLKTSWENGVEPFMNEEIEIEDAWVLTSDPFRDFMASKINLTTLNSLSEFSENYEVQPQIRDTALPLLTASFMLSELERAFQVGFLLFLPFLIIDLVVSAVLMSMGMMMVPPVVVSMPFKLAFFVVSDGWTLVSEALIQSYL